MKKFWNIVKTIFVWIVIVAAVAMMVFTIFSVNTFDQSHRSIFGMKFMIVRTDSMSATDFDAGDLIVIKTVDPATLQAGDIISYTSQNYNNFGETVTHKIRTLTTNENGDAGFVTYGTTTNTDDETIVTYPFVLGKYVFCIPKLGTFFAFLKTIPGYVLCILLPFLLLIGYNGATCVQLFRKYKAEQQAELQAERDQIEAERAENQRMMQELLELKAKLSQSESAPADDSQEPTQS